KSSVSMRVGAGPGTSQCNALASQPCDDSVSTIGAGFLTGNSEARLSAATAATGVGVGTTATGVGAGVAAAVTSGVAAGVAAAIGASVGFGFASGVDFGVAAGARAPTISSSSCASVRASADSV